MGKGAQEAALQGRRWLRTRGPAGLATGLLHRRRRGVWAMQAPGGTPAGRPPAAGLCVSRAGQLGGGEAERDLCVCDSGTRPRFSFGSFPAFSCYSGFV